MFTKRRQYLLVATLLVFAVFCINGCKKTEQSSKGSNSSSGSVPASQPATPKPTATANSAPVSATQSIAEADGETPGTKVQVQELKRSSNSLMLKFAIVNDSEKPVSFGYNFGDKSNEIKDFSSVGGVTLVDSVGKKKYFVVRDTENTCVCSSNLKDIQPGSRMNLWAKFPIPPDDVKKISVVVPHFGPLDDVPISN